VIQLITVVIIEGFSGISLKIKAKKFIQEVEGLDVEVVLIEHFPKTMFCRAREKRKIQEFAEHAFQEISGIDDDIIIVAHSMGCLITRCLIEKWGVKTKATLLVAGPHLGCNNRFKIFSWIPAVKQMLPGSSFLKGLGLSKNEDYIYFFGEKDEIVKKTSACPVETKNVFLYPNGKHNLFENDDFVNDVIKIISQYI